MKKHFKVITTILLLLTVSLTFAQQRTVSGKVTSAGDGMPLPGVNVIVQGTNQGTITDMDGNFSLTVPENATLVFSSLGFGSREVEVGNQSVINLSLTEDLEGLDEVVVTALGITRDKKSLGYATQEVEGEDLILTNEQNVLGSLSGRVA
ncbi:carboxypeptidase-like regulatory domain-containing protein [Antarcticibacterium sp. 1MA-6-2]|uniref:carboxypeptidase-like regulatory domain-containing protein n=1 Tax=Antarcticibacterium sp. 1MA-6-2 TaxID=2908210 RepID=UPI001F1946A7|nr:carboxypeptidase-like regulatory domain-containing protein [Antarcticibacterium sp. 1MA-6-2]UJH90975.1 carboxypeptidase-like regulatory domain-containing protein [Antarcticibacterium sp. 1MA-6-2]